MTDQSQLQAEIDHLGDRLVAVLALCRKAELRAGVLRQPVPEWVAAVRAAASDPNTE